MTQDLYKQQIETLRAQKEAAKAKFEAARQQMEDATEKGNALDQQMRALSVCLGIQMGSIPVEEINRLAKTYGLAGPASNVINFPSQTGKKKKAKKASKKVARSTPNAVTQAPADGTKVPSLVERMKKIMGKRPTKVVDIVEGLHQRPGWAPKSQNLKAYVSSQLSGRPDFVNVSRGVYAVQGSKAAEKALAQASEEGSDKKPTPKAKEKSQAKGKESKEPATKSKRSQKEINEAISAQRRAVAGGTLPTLLVRVKNVLKDGGTMKVSEVLKDLERRGWAPDSADPNTYLSCLLGAEKEHFRKVSRGYYCLADAPITSEEEVREIPKASAKDKDNQEKTESSKEDVDATISDYVSGDLKSNPFFG